MREKEIKTIRSNIIISSLTQFSHEMKPVKVFVAANEMQLVLIICRIDFTRSHTNTQSK